MHGATICAAAVGALLALALGGAEAKEPATCRELAYRFPSYSDGEYALDCVEPVSVYCHGLASPNPQEFLTLHTTGDTNFATYECGPHCRSNHPAAQTIRTNYSKIRINPCTLTVDVSDTTFANSSGEVTHAAQHMTFEPFGVAASCETDAGHRGQAHIDLSRTPFEIASTWRLGGVTPSGEFTLGPNKQVATITGEGYCGQNSPTGWDAFHRTAPQFVLQLALRP